MSKNPTHKWICPKCGECIAEVYGKMDEANIKAYDQMLALHEKRCKGKQK